MRWVLLKRKRGRSTHKNNQLDESLAAHQHANAKALSPQEFAGLRREGASNDLAREGHGDDADNISPGDAVAEKAEVGAQTREGEVERQEQHRDEVLNLLGQLDGEAAVVRTDDTDEKTAEDGMNTDDTYFPGVLSLEFSFYYFFFFFVFSSSILAVQPLRG